MSLLNPYISLLLESGMNALHSTMSLLNRIAKDIKGAAGGPLHSTMSLLNRHSVGAQRRND